MPDKRNDQIASSPKEEKRRFEEKELKSGQKKNFTPRPVEDDFSLDDAFDSLDSKLKGDSDTE